MAQSVPSRNIDIAVANCPQARPRGINSFKHNMLWKGAEAERNYLPEKKLKLNGYGYGGHTRRLDSSLIQLPRCEWTSATTFSISPITSCGCSVCISCPEPSATASEELVERCDKSCCHLRPGLLKLFVPFS